MALGGVTSAMMLAQFKLKFFTVSSRLKAGEYRFFNSIQQSISLFRRNRSIAQYMVFGFSTYDSS